MPGEVRRFEWFRGFDSHTRSSRHGIHRPSLGVSTLTLTQGTLTQGRQGSRQSRHARQPEQQIRTKNPHQPIKDHAPTKHPTARGYQMHSKDTALLSTGSLVGYRLQQMPQTTRNISHQKPTLKRNKRPGVLRGLLTTSLHLKKSPHRRTKSCFAASSMHCIDTSYPSFANSHHPSSTKLAFVIFRDRAG